MKKALLFYVISFLAFVNCGLFQKNNDSAKNGLMALLGIAVFQGNGMGSGSSSDTIYGALAFNSSGTCISTCYHSPSTGGFSSAAENAATSLPLSRSGTVSNLYFNITNSLNASTGLTLRKNGVDTDITFTIPSGSNSLRLTELTKTVTFSAGDTITFKTTTNATSGSFSGSYSFQY